MSSTEAHIKLCNSLMAADRVWEATIDTLTDAVYIFGSDKRLKKINRAGEGLELATRSFLAGRLCCDMLWGLEETGCMVDRAVANGAEVEVELASENKAQRPLLVRVIPHGQDQPQDPAPGCIVIVRDISELRSAEAEGSKNRAFLARDRKSTRLNSSHQIISYAVFCLKKKKKKHNTNPSPPRPSRVMQD